MKKSNALQELTRTPMSGVWSFSDGLSSHTLKIIAIMTMLIDHIAAVLMEGETGYWLLREIGRISFPIFCFLAAEGIAWTSNIFKYALRLGAFALISEVFYDLAFHSTIWDPMHQNVFFTLLLGVVAGGMLREIGQRICQKKCSWFFALCGMLAVLCCLIFAEWLHTDYGMRGVGLILFFYLARRTGVWRYVIVTLCMCFLWWGKIQMYAVLALPILFLYNGKKGQRMPKYAFYAFYPLHLFILWGIKTLL